MRPSSSWPSFVEGPEYLAELHPFFCATTVPRYSTSTNGADLDPAGSHYRFGPIILADCKPTTFVIVTVTVTVTDGIIAKLSMHPVIEITRSEVRRGTQETRDLEFTARKCSSRDGIFTVVMAASTFKPQLPGGTQHQPKATPVAVDLSLARDPGAGPVGHRIPGQLAMERLECMRVAWILRRLNRGSQWAERGHLAAFIDLGKLGALTNWQIPHTPKDRPTGN